MPGVVKEEFRPRETPVSPCAGRSRGRNGLRTPSAVSATSHEVVLNTTSRRQVRSLAPSADTRQRPTSPFSDTEDDAGFMITEVRPAFKPDPDRPMPQALSERSVNVDSDSLLNRNFEKIVNNHRALAETLGELQTLGIQQVARLPSLVLVGDQSSGKSTLMSSIAGISLPHRDGMCTRCPVHIRLSKSDSWSLKISLLQEYSYDGLPAAGRAPRVARDKEFGPWTPQPQVDKPFWSCDNKDDERIRMAIRWAQIAILNHETPFTAFVPKYSVHTSVNMEEEEERLREYENAAVATFSPNTVALRISGPNLPDISFYDLPGLIKTPKHEDDTYLVKVVENLAKKYIADTNAIILWAVPMNADPETSSTLAIIRKEKAQNRTVGVMTKADLLVGRSHEQWLSMLQGKQHRVHHGFFITARKPIGDLDNDNIDLDKQNSFEESFFNGQAAGNLWPVGDFGRYNDRCGLNSLVVYLSDTLNRAFVDGLPGILLTIKSQLGVVQEKLQKLPDTPDNPYAEIKEALWCFMTEVKQTLKPGGEFEGDWGRLIKAFENKIIDMKPRYNVNVASAIQSAAQTPAGSETPGRVTIDLCNGDDAAASTPSFSRRRSHQDFLDGSQDTVNATPKRPRPPMIKEEDESSVATPRARTTTQTRSLEQVRKRINAYTRHGAPGVTPCEVYEELSTEATQQWGPPVDEFVRDFINLLHSRLDELLYMAFKKLRMKAAFTEAQSHLNEFMEVCSGSLGKALTELYLRESKRLYTRDEAVFTTHKADELKILSHRRHYCRYKELLKNANKETRPFKELHEMSPEDEKDKVKEAEKLGKDPYERELEVCAYVRGYYLTAARRFIDSVALAVIAESIPAVVESLTKQSSNYLDEKLGLVGRTGLDEARIEELMSEKPEVATKRKKLQSELEKLTKAVESIVALGTAGSNDNDTGVDVAAASQATATNPATSFASRRNGAHTTTQNGLGETAEMSGVEDDGEDTLFV